MIYPLKLLIFHSNVIYQRVYRIFFFLAGSRMLFFHGNAGCEKISRLFWSLFFVRGKQSKPPGAVRFSQWIPPFIPNIYRLVSIMGHVSKSIWTTFSVRLSAPLGKVCPNPSNPIFLAG
jgi:hypothetical protein